MKILLTLFITILVSSCFGPTPRPVVSKPLSGNNSKTQCLKYGYTEDTPEFESCMNAKKVSDDAPAFQAKQTSKTSH